MSSHFRKKKSPIHMIVDARGESPLLLIKCEDVLLKASDDCWTCGLAKGELRASGVLSHDLDGDITHIKVGDKSFEVACGSKTIVCDAGKFDDASEKSMAFLREYKAAVASKRLVAEWRDGKPQSVMERDILKSTSGNQKIRVASKDGTIREIRIPLLGELLDAKGLAKLYRGTDKVYLVMSEAEGCTVLVPTEDYTPPPPEEKPKGKPKAAQPPPAPQTPPAQPGAGVEAQEAAKAPEKPVESKPEVKAHDPIAELEAGFKTFCQVFDRCIKSLKSDPPGVAQARRKHVEAARAQVESLIVKMRERQ